MLIIGLLFWGNYKSQSLDTLLINRKVKLRLFSELNLNSLSNNGLDDYCNRPLKVIYLKSKGFSNFVFLKIEGQLLAVDSIKDEIKSYHIEPCFKKTDECYFAFAYNTENDKIYRLRGTKNNDFSELYNTLIYSWRYWKKVDKLNSKIIKKFEESFFIEGVDLKCLLNSLNNKKGECLDSYSPPLISW